MNFFIHLIFTFFASYSVIFSVQYKIAATDHIPIPYGIEQLENALASNGDNIEILNLIDHQEADIILIASQEISKKYDLGNYYSSIGVKESFSISKLNEKIIICSDDPKGAMYGILDLAEQISFRGSLKLIEEKRIEPRMEFRAIKFNLPFMPYRAHESLVQHSSTCSDINFWEKYLDMMAMNRFNVLSLWSLHLYHYMIIPKNFPEAVHFSELEMRQWRKLWSGIFKMAKERGIETYIVNWNTFVSPAFARAHNIAEYSEHPWHYGEGENSPLIEKYTREVIRQVIDEYPDLTGLGITLGERMGGQTADERRSWLDRTIFAGMKDAKRKIKFIYRAPLSANASSAGSTSEENDQRTREQIEKMETEGPVWLEFKYNWSHGHSSPDLFIVHGGKLTDRYINPLPKKYKYIWTVRNEDFFIHRWGQSDFIREFIKSNGHEYVGGCFIGSEVFIPALDYTSKEGNHKTWDYSFERLWLWYKMWGRLLYNDNESDNLFTDHLNSRYGNDLGDISLKAWKLASKVQLHFTSFHQGRNDLSMYAEGHTAYHEYTGFRFFDIEKFSTHQVLDTIKYINIEDYVKGGLKTKKPVISPPALADSLDHIHEKCLEYADLILDRPVSETVRAEVSDIEAWAWYAKYLADKLRAGVALYQYRILNIDNREQAVDYLEKCVHHWKNYADATARYNKSSFPFHTKEDFDWYKMLEYVKRDVDLAKVPNERKKIAEGKFDVGGYLFAHMTKDDYGALYYSVSNDGRNWKMINDGKRVFNEYRGHPDIIVGHDGRFYLMGNPPGGGKIRIWASEDLVSWDLVTDVVPDMTDLPEYNNFTYWVGAPKMYFDDICKNYVITWHSATKKRDEVSADEYWGSMRTLCIKTFDFKSFTKPKRLLKEDIASIDVIIRREGFFYYAVIKDERAPSEAWTTGKSLRIGKSRTSDGPFELITGSISPNFREAPMLIKDPEQEKLLLYYEQYPGAQYEMSTSNSIEGPWYHEYGQRFKIPEGARHGCMIALPKEAYLNIVKEYGGKDFGNTKSDNWLYVGFKDPGDGGIWFSLSGDGKKWKELRNGKPWLTPANDVKRMRDPYIARDPRSGYHLVWTVGNQKIGYSHSNDLVHWSPQRIIPVFEKNPDIVNIWAPELFYNDEEKDWYIFWSSTIKGEFPETDGQVDNEKNHRIYYMNTDDFINFTEPKLFYDPGIPVIDATIYKENDTFYMCIKDERDRPLRKQLHIVTSNSIRGPWSKLGEALTEPWSEGGSIIKVDDEYILYYDRYKEPIGMHALKSSDMINWEDISDDISFAPKSKHGSFIKISEDEAASLKRIK